MPPLNLTSTHTRAAAQTTPSLNPADREATSHPAGGPRTHEPVRPGTGRRGPTGRGQQAPDTDTHPHGMRRTEGAHELLANVALSTRPGTP
ncbi:hypothetical protein GCM10010341_82940 [Streptomyces noursei]|nr:hypothetical protein GCM10010341_82940 [Streptomyces noursei]